MIRHSYMLRITPMTGVLNESPIGSLDIANPSPREADCSIQKNPRSQPAVLLTPTGLRPLGCLFTSPSFSPIRRGDQVPTVEFVENLVGEGLILRAFSPGLWRIDVPQCHERLRS